MAGRSLLKILIVHSANLDCIILSQRALYVHNQQKQQKKHLEILFLYSYLNHFLHCILFPIQSTELRNGFQNLH